MRGMGCRSAELGVVPLPMRRSLRYGFTLFLLVTACGDDGSRWERVVHGRQLR